MDHKIGAANMAPNILAAQAEKSISTWSFSRFAWGIKTCHFLGIKVAFPEFSQKASHMGASAWTSWTKWMNNRTLLNTFNSFCKILPKNVMKNIPGSNKIWLEQINCFPLKLHLHICKKVRMVQVNLISYQISHSLTLWQLVSIVCMCASGIFLQRSTSVSLPHPQS